MQARMILDNGQQVRAQLDKNAKNCAIFVKYPEKENEELAYTFEINTYSTCKGLDYFVYTWDWCGSKRMSGIVVRKAIRGNDVTMRDFIAFVCLYHYTNTAISLNRYIRPWVGGHDPFRIDGMWAKYVCGEPSVVFWRSTRDLCFRGDPAYDHSKERIEKVKKEFDIISPVVKETITVREFYEQSTRKFLKQVSKEVK